jgi:hypothetical protein
MLLRYLRRIIERQWLSILVVMAISGAISVDLRLLALSALLCTALAAPVAAHDPQLPETVTLNVDNISASGPYVTITVSGFPPGFYKVKCAARDKNGKYLGVDTDYTPVTGPAYSLIIIIGARSGEVVGADCSGTLAANPNGE